MITTDKIHRQFPIIYNGSGLADFPWPLCRLQTSLKLGQRLSSFKMMKPKQEASLSSPRIEPCCPRLPCRRTFFSLFLSHSDNFVLASCTFWKHRGQLWRPVQKRYTVARAASRRRDSPLCPGIFLKAGTVPGARINTWKERAHRIRRRSQVGQFRLSTGHNWICIPIRYTKRDSSRITWSSTGSNPGKTLE